MLPRCGRVAHICEANNRELYNEMKQKSKRESEESQLPFRIKTVDTYNRKQKNDEVLTVKSVKEFCNEPFYFWDILQKKQRLLGEKQLLFWMIGCKQRAAGERKVF